MKLRKIKPQSAPVPTDNPKPKSRTLAAKAKKRLRVKTEPTPQPVVGRITRTVRTVARVVEPRPQPVDSKAKGLKATAKSTSRSRKKVLPSVIDAPALEVLEEVIAAPVPIVQSAAAHEPVGPSPSVEVEVKSIGRTVRQPRPVPVEIPAILLEPDHVPGDEPVLTGPGARFLVGPSLETAAAVMPGELPESYGTQQIFLAARDPYWLLASWDLEEGQRRRFNGQSASGALTVRLRKGEAEGPIHLEVHVKADSRDWFIYAGAPDTTFVGELGFHEKSSGVWRRISISKSVTMPRDRVAEAPAVTRDEIANISVETRFNREPNQEPLRSPAPAPRVEDVFFATLEMASAPVPAVEHRWEREPERFEAPLMPRRFENVALVWKAIPPPAWTEAQAQALDELISLELRKSQHGSLEIEELLRRHIGQPAGETAPMEAPSSLEMVRIEELLGLAKPEGPSSLELAEAPERRKSFWFKVNAELIIYGATEPDAHVTIGGRSIRLREDGTFSYRFALPDGEYGLPVLAIAHDYSEARGADLRFARGTEYLGEVGTHAQDSALKTPSATNV